MTAVKRNIVEIDVSDSEEDDDDVVNHDVECLDKQKETPEKIFYRAFTYHGVEYATGDFVKTSAQNEEQEGESEDDDNYYICEILNISQETESNTVMIEGRWFYKISEIPEEYQKYFKVPSEIFYSFHEDVNYAECVVSHATIHFIMSEKYFPQHRIPGDFYCRFMWDLDFSRFLKLTVDTSCFVSSRVANELKKAQRKFEHVSNKLGDCDTPWKKTSLTKSVVDTKFVKNLIRKKDKNPAREKRRLEKKLEKKAKKKAQKQRDSERSMKNSFTVPTRKKSGGTMIGKGSNRPSVRNTTTFNAVNKNKKANIKKPNIKPVTAKPSNESIHNQERYQERMNGVDPNALQEKLLESRRKTTMLKNLPQNLPETIKPLRLGTNEQKIKKRPVKVIDPNSVKKSWQTKNTSSKSRNLKQNQSISNDYSDISFSAAKRKVPYYQTEEEEEEEEEEQLRGLLFKKRKLNSPANNDPHPLDKWPLEPILARRIGFEIEDIVITRTQVFRWLNLIPTEFDSLILNFFVRVPVLTEDNKRVYSILQIVYCEKKKFAPYSFCGDNLEGRTRCSRGFSDVKSPTSLNLWKLDSISNSPPTDIEIYQWQLLRDHNYLTEPTIHELYLKKKHYDTEAEAKRKRDQESGLF